MSLAGEIATTWRSRFHVPLPRIVRKHELLRHRTFVAYLMLGLLYKLLLDYAFLCPLQDFSLGAYECALDVNAFKWVVSTIMALFLSAALPKQDGAASLVVQLGLLYIVMPMVCVYALRNGPTLYFLLFSATYLVVELVISAAHASANDSCDRKVGLNKPILATLFAVTGLFFIGMLATQGLPSLTAFDLGGIYEFREEVEISGLLASLLSPMAKAILPFLLCIGLLGRNYPLAISAFVLELLLFMWTGHKTYLFLICVVFVVVLLYRPNRNLLICTLFVALVALCTVSYWLVHVPGLEVFVWPFSLFVRRALYVPAVLKFSYYDYFEGTENPLNLLGTVLSPLALGPEPVTGYEYMIGGLYTGSFETNANTGMYGEEIASFGVAGVPLASLFFTLFAFIVGFSARKNGDCYALAIALPFLLNFANASVVKTMLHAYGLMVIVLLVVYDHAAKSSEGGRRNATSDA